MDDKCIIVSNMVTGICKMMAARGAQALMCNMAMAIGSISPRHSIIEGTISTSNIIMASWSRTMWQSVVNKSGADVFIGARVPLQVSSWQKTNRTQSKVQPDEPVCNEPLQRAKAAATRKSTA
ncbi:hypothetical protein KIN20_031856 [Parelaphostrongylus tenuis]|uniref:Uncharacterized protein n=1 Tax=Parelaphostrongylus tenuis TaxID=148309 RepID=A0AAD5R600_PARTN|nr:hypothetical protein KIN20_031856 [Parelaphostrongylus tenuis]